MPLHFFSEASVSSSNARAHLAKDLSHEHKGHVTSRCCHCRDVLTPAGTGLDNTFVGCKGSKPWESGHFRGQLMTEDACVSP